jgi:hypothetical protein
MKHKEKAREMEKKLMTDKIISFKDFHQRGMDGHFILRHKCRFRLCTFVGNYMISSCGALYEDERFSEHMSEIGLNRHYEIMVFDLKTESMSEIDFQGFKYNKNKDCPYELDITVEKAHHEMCIKYMNIHNDEVLKIKGNHPNE